jgi:phosphate-selective porin OprO/OprP
MIFGDILTPQFDKLGSIVATLALTQDRPGEVEFCSFVDLGEVRKAMQSTRRTLSVVVLAGLVAGWGEPAAAGVVVYEEGETKIEIGGRIQIQYLRIDPDDGEAVDRVFFRRLRPYLAGTVTQNWWGVAQVDFGESLDAEEVTVKDAYMLYRGWKNLKLTIGNSKTPFSREFLTTSRNLGTVARGFVGDHNFGSPDRQLGLKLEGQNSAKKITWAVAAGGEHHDPNVLTMDFDTPANNLADWNEGLVVAGRVDFHPRGFLKFEHADFQREELKYNFSLAAFSWSNDDDNNTYTDPENGLSTNPDKADLDSAEGFEVSAGLRGHGLTVAGQYNSISGDTVDLTFTGGIYRDGATDLDQIGLMAGYMLVGHRVEVVGKWDRQDADNYEDAWSLTTLGLNYFWNRHKVKLQLNYRMTENLFGIRGNDQDATAVQMQFVF